MSILLAHAPRVWCANEGDDALVFIRNGQIELGVLPQAAGRVVVLRKPGGSNVLDSRPEQWRDIPEAKGDSDFVPIGGHMLWVAPQSHWWRQQHSFRTPASTWPPDPWLIMGRYRILEHTEDTMVLEGPASPISGLQMKKSYRLDGNRVVVTSTATNSRDAAVTWGLWSNLQVRPSADAFAIGTDTTYFELRFATKNLQRSHAISYTWIGKVLAVPQTSADLGQEVSGKVFLKQALPALAAVGDDFCLAIFPATEVQAKDVAPDHAPIEIFRGTSETGVDSLELEHHGVYRSLEPGEQMSLTEAWVLHDYHGGAELGERAAFAASRMLAPAPETE